MLETSGCKVVCVMVGLTTEVMIAVVELEAPGSKVVSEGEVGIPLVREMSGFKDVVEPSVETVVEGFKVVSAAVINDVTDAIFSDVVDVVSELVAVSSSKVVSLTALRVVVEIINSVDVSGLDGETNVDSEAKTDLCVKDVVVGSLDDLEDIYDNIEAVIGLAAPDGEFVATTEYGDKVMG